MLTAVGLVSALVGDDAWDVASWLMLGADRDPSVALSQEAFTPMSVPRARYGWSC
jgi:hypothetical protein